MTERPVPNAAVALVAVPGTKVAETTTSGTGEFTLEAMPPSEYAQ
jgi:hypothetical protein